MNFSSNFFWKLDLIWFFRDLHVRKFRKFSPDHVYDENFQFYDKKTDFRTGMEITSETTIPESRVRRRKPGNPLGGLVSPCQAPVTPLGMDLSAWIDIGVHPGA